MSDSFTANRPGADALARADQGNSAAGPSAGESRRRARKMTTGAKMYRQIVELIFQNIHDVDFRDKAEFHTFLFLIDGLCEDNLVEAYIDLEQSHLGVSGDPFDASDKSITNKFNKWKNYKQSPGKLNTRRAVIASALQCLVEGVEDGSALPLKAKSDMDYCEVPETEKEFKGLGEYAHYVDCRVH